MNSKVLKLISPIPPSVNHYLGYRTVKKGGKYLAVSYKKPEAVKYQKNFKEYIIRESLIQHWDKVEDKFRHVYYDCVFYFPRIDMDANNYFKCMLDAVTDAETVWSDDTQCRERVQGLYYDSKNPRVEITITVADNVGIFDNEEQSDNFEDRCKHCSRYKRNCKLLRQAKEGRIQEEITDFICSKYKESEE